MASRRDSDGDPTFRIDSRPDDFVLRQPLDDEKNEIWEPHTNGLQIRVLGDL